MDSISNKLVRIWTQWRARSAVLLGVVFLLSLACTPETNSRAAPQQPKTAPEAAAFNFPTVPARHKHVRDLLENAMRYVAPTNKMIDPASGYPVEGWNHDPQKGLFLRSFTQLTAIGLWMELLANTIAGYADTPFLSREQALEQLTHLVKSLRQDQRDPRLSIKGLLGNFLDLSSGKRLGPLASDVDKQMFLDEFGQQKGEAIWKALQTKGWIVSRQNDREASIQRGVSYGWDFFDGSLAPYKDDATKKKILAILDRRVIMIVFGDNANLSTAVAKTIGALLLPDIKDKPKIVELRQELERFLEDQQPGYARLYDAKIGLFYFGWDATRDRLFGWIDPNGKWKTGHMDYLVNEFRDPTTFVVLRFGQPLAALKNLGFKMKPYRMQDGREVYCLAPWEGSAFQAMGLGLSLGELKTPSWRRLMENVVDVEIDYSTRKKLPGFLSESYTGNGTQYTGEVGIPALSVAPKPRITDAASLYTLGVAYTIAPDKIEQFLAANWPIVSKLLTDHGPWEGFNITKKEVIPFQTTAHTLSLILGFLGTESEQMQRYLNSRGLGERLEELFKPGQKVDFLSDKTQVFAWTDKESSIQSTREKESFHVKGDPIKQVGIAFVPGRPEGVNLSGTLLNLRYRSTGPLGSVLIDLKPAGNRNAEGLISKQIFTHFVEMDGQEKELQIPLPATPGLAQIKEVVITSGQEKERRPIDLRVTHLGIAPIGVASGP